MLQKETESSGDKATLPYLSLFGYFPLSLQLGSGLPALEDAVVLFSIHLEGLLFHHFPSIQREAGEST